MSFFEKIFFKTFLFLAFIFFTLSAHASKTYFYFSTGSFCSAVPDTVCQSLNFSNGTDYSRTYSGDVSVTGEGMTCGFNITYLNYNGPGQHVTSNFSGEYAQTYHAVKLQKICADDEQFVLNGCVAECVKNDPCEATKDREEQLRVQCGIMSCQAGATIKDLGAGVGMACSSGNGTFIPSEPPAKLKRGECEWVQSGALETPNKLEDVTGDMTEAGGQNAPTYCTTTYKSLGRKWQGAEPSPTQKESTQPKADAKKFAPSVAAPNADGGCNEGWTLGEFGSGSNLTKVCAAPYGSPTGGSGGNNSGGGSGGSCTITGQTQVNGVCSCPTGQTVVGGACTGSGTGSSGSGSASGSCQNAPSCSADPLQCASLEQVWKSSCEQTKANLDVTDEHINASNEQISEANDDLSNAQDDANQKASDFFSDFQSKATAATSAQCIQDVNLAVMGKQLTVPFSQACEFFRFLRVLVIFSAYMLAARILFGGLT